MSIRYYVFYKEVEGGICELYSVQPSQEKLDDSNAITITKEQVSELVPVLNNPANCVKIKKEDLDIFKWYVEDKDLVVVAKENAVKVSNQHYSQVMNGVAIFEMYNVMMINNELAANGYFITSNNREEKYIDIINSGDEKLITLLQEYLEMKDRIDPMWEYYNKTKEFNIKLKDMKTVDEIDVALDNLISYVT